MARMGVIFETQILKKALIYSVWRTCFTFFETVEDGRVHFCLKKNRALPKEITARFQETL